MATEKDPQAGSTTRRGFFGKFALAGSLAASYGLFAAYAVRFVFPETKERKKTKLFIAFADELPRGGSHYFNTPNGEEYVLTQSESPSRPYAAFSSKCPHLGCRVHWQNEARQFYCPCHGGAFDPNGKAIAGPPAKANQELKSVAVEREGNSIYAYVELA
jgi:Rieske Fe-S protein